MKLKSEWKISIPSMDEQLNLSWIGVVSISLSHTLLTRPDSSKRFFSANPRFVNFSLSLSLPPFNSQFQCSQSVFLMFSVSFSDRWRNGKSLLLFFVPTFRDGDVSVVCSFALIRELCVCGFCWCNAFGLFLFAEFGGFFCS